MFFNRMVFAAILSNLVVFLAVWVHGDGGHMEAYLVIPLPFLMIGFKFYCKRAFDDKMHYYTIKNMLKDPEASRGNLGAKKDRLASRFGHPALYRPLITPMVHQKAQYKLAAIYGGRLTDSNTPASGESTSISGYSDTYALDPMKTGQPGKKAGGVPGFEMVPENRLDFAYFKGRAEFGEEHGGNGGIYGRAEDIVRSDTPGSQSAWSGDISRPGTPGTPTMEIKRKFTDRTMPVSYNAQGDIGVGGGHNPVYGHRNDSESNLVVGAASMAVATPGTATPPHHLRDDSQERRAPGFLGGGPQGYGGLPQAEEDPDPMAYDYFRSRRQPDQYRG